MIDLARFIRPGDTVMWGQAAAEPLTLTRALVAQRHELGRLRIFVGIGMSDTLRPEHADAFGFIGYAAAGSHRALAQAGVLDILPCHYSQLPALIAGKALQIDVLMLQVSPPDSEGRHSLGLACEYLLAAFLMARVVIAEVNPDVPWVYGERSFFAHEFDLVVPAEAAPVEPPAACLGAVELAIGRHVAGWIEDGATLQVGIGAVPDAVLASLAGHRDLGLHTGGAGDGVAALAQAGVLTNSRKSIDHGIAVAGVLMGGAALRRWAHCNPELRLRSTAYTHCSDVLARIDRFAAINSAIEVDLTGQINAEVAGGRYVGAVGGSVDFMRGAARSRGGLPIVALPATAAGASRIVSKLSGPSTIARSDAGLVVTEHGVADLRGQSLAERVRRLVAIADPAHQETLCREAHHLLASQAGAQ